MKKKILSLLLIFIMSFSFAAANAEEEAVHPDEQQAITFSDNLTKQLIRAYAHDIADNYYYGVSDAQLLYSIICDAIEGNGITVDGAVKSMIETLGDEYAKYYTPVEYAALIEDVRGEFSGIGVVISAHENGVLVNSVMENSPALKAGIQEGDVIIAVNETPVAGMEVSKIKELIVGAADTTVVVRVLRGETQIDYTCVRGAVEVSNIETKMLTDDIAYIRILQFAKNTPREVREYVRDIKSREVKKLIIDVRNNPGGDLDSAVQISSIFVRSGDIAEIRYKDATKNKFLKSNNSSLPGLKLAVLVNENSASASELFSMAIKTKNAGELIGTKTYGKGSMQSLGGLYTGGGMKYTIGEFYSINGERVHTVGITPDIYVENEVVRINEEEFVKIDYDRMEEAGKDGEMTLALEQRLKALSLLEEADEVFDDNTRQAVKLLQKAIGYEETGEPGFYEYLYLNDFDYDFEIIVDKQIDAAVEYISKQ